MIFPLRERDRLIILENEIIKRSNSSYTTFEILIVYLSLNFKRSDRKLIILDRCATSLGNEINCICRYQFKKNYCATKLHEIF